MTSKGCPKQGKPETIKIKPLGFTEELEIILNFVCECECHKDGIVNSSKCHLNGTYECGDCKYVRVQTADLGAQALGTAPSNFCFLPGVTRDAWAESANAAATTWPQTTWTEPAARTTPLTSAATTGTVCVANVSARTGTTPRRDTAASSASVTTSAAIAPATSCAAVSAGPTGAEAQARGERTAD